MSITIIVEDGSGVVGANSYVSAATATAFANDRGVTLPTDADALAAMLVRATDYLETFSLKFIGYKTDSAQALSWPRTDAYLNGALVCGANEIPALLINAQLQLVLALNGGYDPLAILEASDYVTEKTIGPITTKYADPLSVGIGPKMLAVEASLEPLLNGFSSSTMFLQTIRV